ncbi:hypothetical protein DB346_16035 [Verrucomicrobia bacterium LW23]|nr:hypothetical protein DB346_16035 [Verrucomicrobia bacterium LW23]
MGGEFSVLRFQIAAPEMLAQQESAEAHSSRRRLPCLLLPYTEISAILPDPLLALTTATDCLEQLTSGSDLTLAWKNKAV